MQYLVLPALALPGRQVFCRIRLLRCCGYPRSAMALYRRAAWLLGGTALLGMLLQELALWRGGLLSWRTGLPLHLCSFAGCVTLPMLLSGSRSLWHFCLFAGMPGAAMALLFPSMAASPWPVATALGFFLLHGALLLAPLLPVALGRRPGAVGALSAAGILTLLALGASLVNSLTGSNYLFLARPIPDTPLALLGKLGQGSYQAALIALALFVLLLEGLGMKRFLRKVRGKTV